jgi:hypothetical protein
VAIVTELDLPQFDYTATDLTGEVYHRRLAEVGARSWLVKGPLSYVVLDRDAGEFFLRSRATAFPGRQIADLFGVTGGRLREQIDANILNQTGEHHRRLRALVGPAFTPRAADRWRPVMRGPGRSGGGRLRRAAQRRTRPRMRSASSCACSTLRAISRKTTKACSTPASDPARRRASAVCSTVPSPVG